MEKVLIAGATGYLGNYLIKASKERGYFVRALTRDGTRLDDTKEYINEVYEGEITKKNSIDKICDGIDYVISSVGITKQRDNLTYMDVDYQANKHLLDEALKSDVSKFIYVSVINPDLISDLEIIKAKERFARELVNSGLNCCIVRPTGFYSDMLEFFKMVNKGRVFLLGSGENRMNPIHGEDLANVTIEAFKKIDKEINVGGPEIYSYKEIASLAFKVLDKKEKITTIPDFIADGLVHILRKCTSSKIYGPVEFMASVMRMDNIGEIAGEKSLQDWFIEHKDI